MDDLARWYSEQLDVDAGDARRGYLTAEPLPDHDGWDTSTTAGLPPAVAARVLREIDGKRELLKEHAPGTPKGRPNMERHCLTCTTAQAWDETANEANCLILRLLAAPYTGRPGYRETWRP